MSNTINIVQPKAEDGVTEVSFVTRTNSIFKSDGTPFGDSMDAYMDEVDELSSNLPKKLSPINGTTNANGAMSLGLSATDYTVLSAATETGTSARLIPFIASNTWYVMSIGVTSGTVTVIANTAIEVTCEVIEH